MGQKMTNACQFIMGIDYSKESPLVEYCGANAINAYSVRVAAWRTVDGVKIQDPVVFEGYYCDDHIRQIGRELGAGYRFQLRKTDAE